VLGRALAGVGHCRRPQLAGGGTVPEPAVRAGALMIGSQCLGGAWLGLDDYSVVISYPPADSLPGHDPNSARLAVAARPGARPETQAGH
jgi:hypothetical protein